ncbi:15325_t:CDS:2 [Entrophospora sp. SA101]|nr:15325_t:CDS:2 [Entrophospora sp. SA101]
MEPHENMTCILPESVVVRLWENLDGSDVSRDILHNEENEPEPQGIIPESGEQGTKKSWG